MPWRCFVCSSDRHDCGHREQEIVAHARREGALNEQLKTALEDRDMLERRIERMVRKRSRAA